MKNFIFLCVLCLLTSCQVKHETWIHEDGSGQFEFTMDMSELMGLGAMMGDMSEEETPYDQEADSTDMDEEPMHENIIVEEDESEGSDFLKNLFSDPTSMEDIDTTFFMYDAMSDREKERATEGQRKLYVKVKSNKEESINIRTFGAKYDSLEELEEIMQGAGKGQDDQNTFNGSPLEGMGKLFEGGYALNASNGIVVIPEIDFGEDFSAGFSDKLGMGDGEEIDEQKLAMAEMMFGSMDFSFIYHLPGQVEFTNDLNAEIDGNDVTFTASMIELLKGDPIPKRVIKYKTK